MMTDVVFKRKAKRRKRRTEKKVFRGRRRGGKRGGGDGVARDARVLSGSFVNNFGIAFAKRVPVL
jgi:hypothetical protein